MVSIALQTERWWPDPATGPWRLRVSFAATPDRLIPIGVEMWGDVPPTPDSRWAVWPTNLRQPGPVSPLTPSGLRLPLARLAEEMSEAAAHFLPTARAQGLAEVAVLDAVVKARRRRGRPPLYPPEHFADVAAVYRCADGRGRILAVAAHYDVSRPTAAGWVKRARRLGLLQPLRRTRS